MNFRLKKLSLLSLLFLGVIAATVITEPSDARVYISGGVSVRFDSGGYPIWGYCNSGRPIYAYDPYGVPIYITSGIYPGCFVPTWRPAAHYRGHFCAPRGVYYGHYHGHSHYHVGCRPHYGRHRPHHGGGYHSGGHGHRRR